MDYVLKYVITGRQDGSWIVQAFDRKDKQIGITVMVKTPSEAWKIWCLLNGYAYVEPIEYIEKTMEVA